MNINLEYYKVFYYVAKLSSITLAAENLFISQPAVSQSIKQLEENIGCSLFYRTQKGVRLTYEGEILFSYVSKGYENILIGEKEIERMLDFKTGEIRIGSSSMALLYYLLPILDKFHSTYPKIKVKISNDTTHGTINSMHEGKLDLGVVMEPVDNDKSITSYPVCKIHDIFIAGPKFKELQNEVIPFSFLKNYPVVCLEKHTSSREYIDKFLFENHIIMEPEFELAANDLIVPFVEKNFGIGIVVENYAKDSIKQGKIFKLNMEKDIPGRNICVIMSNKNDISQAGKEFINMLHII